MAGLVQCLYSTAEAAVNIPVLKRSNLATKKITSEEVLSVHRAGSQNSRILYYYHYYRQIAIDVSKTGQELRMGVICQF